MKRPSNLKLSVVVRNRVYTITPILSKHTKSRAFSSAPSVSSTSSNNENDSDLFSNVSSMIENPNNKSMDNLKMESIIHEIRNLDPFVIDDKLSIASCHFMILYHQTRLRRIKSKETELNELKREQYNDMKFGWILLQNVIDNSQNDKNVMSAVILKTEVATKLKDSYLLKESFDEMLKYESQFNDQHLLIAFATASFLGDWQNMNRFGEILKIQNEINVDQIPTDFSIIHELVEKHQLKDKKDIDINKLFEWETLNVLKIRIKLKEVDCEEYVEKRKQAMDEIVGNKPIEWEDVKASYSNFRKMGAIVQTVSFCQQPNILYGPFIPGKINMIGKQKYIADASQGLISVLEEEWDLTQNDKVDKLYTGTYRLSQTVELPQGKERTIDTAPIHMTWDFELYLGDHVLDF